MRAWVMLGLLVVLVGAFVVLLGSPVRDGSGVFTPATCPGCDPVEVDL